jgi:hypothetical protein
MSILQSKYENCSFVTWATQEVRTHAEVYAVNKETAVELGGVNIHMKIHYHVHMSTSFIPIPSQKNLNHMLSSHFFKIHFNIILPSMPSLPSASFRTRTRTCAWHHHTASIKKKEPEAITIQKQNRSFLKHTTCIAEDGQFVQNM